MKDKLKSTPIKISKITPISTNLFFLLYDLSGEMLYVVSSVHVSLGSLCKQYSWKLNIHGKHRHEYLQPPPLPTGLITRQPEITNSQPPLHMHAEKLASAAVEDQQDSRTVDFLTTSSYCTGYLHFTDIAIHTQRQN